MFPISNGMDIVSHGLWGGAAFGRKSKKNFWLAFFFGIAPDLFSFGIYSFSTLFGFEEREPMRAGQMNPDLIPGYVHSAYNFTHSLIIFAIIFCVVWMIRKKAPVIMLGWPLHIIFDIFTHSNQFFPTPFLWPMSSYRFDGISWANPKILIPNLVALLVIYTVWAISRRRKENLRRGS